MSLLVCGSRDWTDAETIDAALSVYRTAGRHVTVLHGDARGADTIADACARRYGYRVRRFPARWREHGNGAGFRRNIEMLDVGPDKVLAFQLRRSPGTEHTVTEARKRGIAVDLYTLD